MKHLVFAEPRSREARWLKADALEQPGYQSESGPWRNFYLTGAQELRERNSEGTPGAVSFPKLLRDDRAELDGGLIALARFGGLFERAAPDFEIVKP